MKIKNVKVAFLEESIIRSSWPHQVGEPMDFKYEYPSQFVPDEKDTKRAEKLANTPNGSGHNNFLKGIIVQFDLKYPEYFSPQLQRYHWIDIVSSQSKMHKITSRELTKDDFTINTLPESIKFINHLIIIYNDCQQNDKDEYFNKIISNLPSGYMKWMGISTNYLQLKTIYNQRCRYRHKLKEWAEFGEFIESLPISELITGNKNN
jgi:hypothetical protein